MEGFKNERFDYRKYPIDLGAMTTLEELANVKRKAQLLLSKQALQSIAKSGVDSKKAANDLKRGVISPESSSYLIAVRNGLVPEEKYEIETSRKPSMNSCPISTKSQQPVRPSNKVKLPKLKVSGYTSGITAQRTPTPNGMFTKRYRF